MTERVVASLLAVTGVGELLFWVAFYTVGLAPAQPPHCYMEYESAFVIPDIAMALALLSAAVLRWRGHPDGPAVTAAAAGSLVMLGMLDVSFNLKNGVYAASAADLISNGLLNLYCVSFGLTLIWHASRRARVAVVHA